MVLGSAEWILPEDLPEELVETEPAGSGTYYHETVKGSKKDLILKAVQQTNGNDGTARLATGHPSELSTRLRSIEICSAVLNETFGSNRSLETDKASAIARDVDERFP